jgi:hypothetical protein
METYERFMKSFQFFLRLYRSSISSCWARRWHWPKFALRRNFPTPETASTTAAPARRPRPTSGLISRRKTLPAPMESCDREGTAQTQLDQVRIEHAGQLCRTYSNFSYPWSTSSLRRAAPCRGQLGCSVLLECMERLAVGS